MALTTDEIVAELIALDSSLALRRDELVALVYKLKATKPNAVCGRSFKKKLLYELRKREKQKKELSPFIISFPFFTMDSRFIFAGGGAVVGVLLTFFAVNQPWNGGMPILPTIENQSSVNSALEVAPGAFGSLKISDSQEMGRGGGGAGGGGGMYMPDGSTVEYEYKQTQYIYNGEITLPNEDIEVYRKNVSIQKPSVTSGIRGFAQNLFDWSEFGDMEIRNVNLAQKGNNAYTFYIDYNEGSLSMYQDYNYTSRPDANCRDEKCFEQYRLKEADMIPDEEAVSIASAFVDKYGIDVSSYGPPKVVSDWRLWYAQSPEKSSFYFPEQIQVTFPLLINGIEVYEEYGQPYGVTVGVDVRTKNITNLYNYMLRSYEKSEYAPADNVEEIKEIVKSGGIYNWRDPNATIVDAILGEPIQALMHVVKWDQEKGKSDELFVPSLVFPIEKQAEGTMDQKMNVVVPLAKELLQNDGMYPIPLMEDAIIDEEEVDTDVSE